MFDRVGVFLTDDDVVFFNEGERADESMRAFFDDPVRSTARTLAGRVRRPTASRA